jgi:hypothetical protein
MAASRFNDEVQTLMQIEKEKGECLTQPSPSKGTFPSFIGTLACIFELAPSSIQIFLGTDTVPAHLPAEQLRGNLNAFIMNVKTAIAAYKRGPV